MNACGIDASVVAAALLREEHTDAARGLLASAKALHAPDLIYAEVASVMWKRHNRGELMQVEARDMFREFVQRVPIRTRPSQTLADLALGLALRTKETVYDCLYVALALEEDMAMFTADKRLVKAVAGSELEKHVRWIGEK